MNPYASLPRVDDLVDAAHDLVDVHGRDQVVTELRRQLDLARAAIGDGRQAPDDADVVRAAGIALQQLLTAGPRRVINAAGVMVHTNLGRAPLSAAAVEAMVQASRYSDLEFDLAGGGRGSRGDHVDGLLARAVGAEDAMVVNNCAAALVLALMATAAGRDVLVSRGHLVEIGGSFRLPDIMGASGARMVEVGTTNRTRASDYAPSDQAAPGDVAALLTIHPSNFTQAGFVSQPSLREVSEVAHTAGVPHIHDAGSGLLADSTIPGLAGEPSLAGALASGVHLVLASGDKLLGGPQAGLIAGSAVLVDACRRHPMARAMRIDKLRLAALSATLVEVLRGGSGTIVDQLTMPSADLHERAAAMAEALGGQVTESTTMIGGGSAPGVGVPSPVVRIASAAPNRLAAGLRASEPVPVVCRVMDDAVVVDLRTIQPDEDPLIIAAFRSCGIDGT